MASATAEHDRRYFHYVTCERPRHRIGNGYAEVRGWWGGWATDDYARASFERWGWTFHDGTTLCPYHAQQQKRRNRDMDKLDVEIVEMDGDSIAMAGWVEQDSGAPFLPGWYWWRLPRTKVFQQDGPHGPFDTQALALADAQEVN